MLTQLFREQPQLATCRTVFQAAREEDAVAIAIVSRAIYKLGAALAGLLHIFDPEIVILGGNVADAGADLLVPLQEVVWSRSRGLLAAMSRSWSSRLPTNPASSAPPASSWPPARRTDLLVCPFTRIAKLP